MTLPEQRRTRRSRAEDPAADVEPGGEQRPGGRRGGSSATTADVATLAGVSLGTVSKALNGRGQLRAETRARVFAAAEQLGFQPNMLARGLLAGRTYTVGLITTDSFGRFTIPIMLGAEDALGVGQISVFLCDGREDPLREQHYVRSLTARQVDGILVTGRRSDPRPPIAKGSHVPVVYALTQSADPADTSVTPDDEEGGRLAVEHLLTAGRSRIGYLGGPREFLAARLRAKGGETALRRGGATWVEPGPLYGAWSEEWGRQGVGLLLGRGMSFDALVCCSDQIARGAADALREAGRRVPEDVALVGFDNWTVMAEACRPPLTTIDPDLVGIGRAAAGKLLQAIDGDPEPGVFRHPGRLVVRASSGGHWAGR